MWKRFINISKTYFPQEKIYVKYYNLTLIYCSQLFGQGKTVQVYSRICRAIKQVGTFVLSNHNVDRLCCTNATLNHPYGRVVRVMNERAANA